jgi:hypothetical protein
MEEREESMGVWEYGSVGGLEGRIEEWRKAVKFSKEHRIFALNLTIYTGCSSIRRLCG